jgi:DNA-binding response OmpR family regulator
MSALVLVVDDEPAVNDLICDALHLAGFKTHSASDGLAALQFLRSTTPDLVILDINMPKIDGYETLTRMREAGDHTPVIVLTARQERDDTRAGFERGADDFVHKPFSIEELIWRVRAVLRRSSAPDTSGALTVGEVRLDPARHLVTALGEAVDLSSTEFRLLEVLMENQGLVLGKDQLLSRVWGLGAGVESTVVETYVSYLRRKLGESISIRTVRGVGYQLQEPRR